MKITFSFFFSLLSLSLYCQADRWQQRVEYQMDIDFDVNTHRFEGKQDLTYYNNSPDTLERVFYHLYLNAFQPGSMMDVRSRTIADPSSRIGDQISKLTEEEIGYQKVNALKQDGKAVTYQVVGTILEVELAQPLLPGEKTRLEMEFRSQVPVQIRRNGRDNKEGIAYSMSQWYPKLCEYDYQGWHANPYIGREFHGVWGDFDVKITIDADYVIGGTGYLQNPEEIGHGYLPEGEPEPEKGDQITYHFKAPNVIDFMWAADPDYKHVTRTREDGLVMHFFYQSGEGYDAEWEQLPAIMDRAFDFINTHYGQYPYEQFSFVQGGDGGMEYPMSTLITGDRNLTSLVGVSVHELFHSWFQGVLATNESLYSWMDEGFTSYASAETMNWLAGEGLLPGRDPEDNFMEDSYRSYVRYAESGYEEPLTTHSDHFFSNYGYGRSAYTKGAVLLAQLRYIMGDEAWRLAMLRYFDSWKFKHPNDNDFFRIMEKESGLELDWYREYFVFSTKTIDYGVKSIESLDAGKSQITLERVRLMPMPLDVKVVFGDGTEKAFNIPLRIMRGHKKAGNTTILEDWPWTHPEYSFEVEGEVVEVIIDPEEGMADVDRSNNRLSARP